LKGQGFSPAANNPQSRKPRGQKDKQEHEANPARPRNDHGWHQAEGNKTLSPPNTNKAKEIQLAGYLPQTAKIETGTS
jgi:hypothetical protein